MTDMPWYVRAAISASIIALLAIALIASYWFNDDSNRQIIIGAIIAAVSTVIGYYFGSSESSRTKDATISAATTALATSTPSPLMRAVEPPLDAGKPGGPVG